MTKVGYKVSAAYFCFGLLLFCDLADANQSRRMKAIATPENAALSPQSPALSSLGLDQDVLFNAIVEALQKWNREGFSDLTAGTLYDGQRLSEVIAEQLPPDAKLIVLGIGNVAIVQRLETVFEQRAAVANTISVTARYQIEYFDSNGWQNPQGESVFTFQIFTAK